MKRMIGLLMVGLMVSVVESGGDEDNPVNSNQDLLVGTWSFEDGDLVNFSSDGTSVSTVEEFEEEIEVAGTWSLTGDKLTITYDQNEFRELLKEFLAAETDLSDLSDAQIEELLDEVMAEDSIGLVVVLTINSITDAELITTDEDGEREVATRQIGTAVISSTWGEMKASAHP